MCSFSISEPIKTDKTTYMHCQSKSPKSHRYNFSSRLSVLLKVKPLTIFFCVALIFRCRSPQNHRYFLWKILAWWFFWFRSPQNHRYYLVENLGLVFSLVLSGRPFCDFKHYKNIFLFQCNMVCCNNRHRIMAVC